MSTDNKGFHKQAIQYVDDQTASRPEDETYHLAYYRIAITQRERVLRLEEALRQILTFDPLPDVDDEYIDAVDAARATLDEKKYKEL